MAQIKTTPIERVRNISKKDFLENYYKPQKPLFIQGLTENWAAFQKWNLDYIQQHAGEQIVPLYNNEPTKGKQNSAEPATKMKMADYIELIKTQPTDLRIFFYDLKVKLPELLKDFEYPDIGLKFFKRLPVLFFGGEGSKVLPHYDMDLADLVHFHFQGTKSVILFSPKQTKYLYKIPFAVHNLESIDLDNPDFEKYPALKYVEGASRYYETRRCTLYAKRLLALHKIFGRWIFHDTSRFSASAWPIGQYVLQCSLYAKFRKFNAKNDGAKMD